MRIGILENGEVVDVIIASEEFANENYKNNWVQIDEPEVEPEPDYPKVNQTEWLIDTGPFFDRFGAAKMHLLVSQDTLIKALIKDIQIRKWVDLKLPGLRQLLEMAASIVPELTEEIIESILETPVSDFENLALRKLYFS